MDINAAKAAHRGRACPECASEEIEGVSGPRADDGLIVIGYACRSCRARFEARIPPRTDFERRAESFARARDEARRLEEIRTEARRQASAADASELAAAKAAGLAQLDREIRMMAKFDAAPVGAEFAHREDLRLIRTSASDAVIQCACGMLCESGPRDLVLALWSLGHLSAACKHAPPPIDDVALAESMTIAGESAEEAAVMAAAAEDADEIAMASAEADED